MAIAYDATANNEALPGPSPLTWSHTCTGTDGLLLVGFYANGGDTVTGVTYNSIALTQLAKVQISGVSTFYQYGLLAPATGSHTVSVAFSGGDDFVRGISASYTGVKQTGLPDATATGSVTASSSSKTQAITVVANNSWVAIFEGNGDGTSSAGTNITSRNQATNNDLFGDSNGPVAPGSFSMTVNYSPNTTFAGLVLVSFAPVVTNRGFLSIL